MHPRQLRLLGLFGGIAAALAGIYLLAPEAQPDGVVVHGGFSLDQARTVRLERHVDDRQERVELEKSDGIWWVTTPFEAPADPDVVFGVLNAVSRARRGRPVSGDPAGFGLDPAQVEVEVGLRNGAPIRLEVGDTAPVGLATYVRSPDGVAVVEGHPADELTKRVQEYRDHKVFRFEPGEVRRIAIQSFDGLLEARKSERGWYLDGYSRVDLDALDDWIMDMLRLRVDMFLDLDHTTIEGARFTVEVETETGVQRLQLGRDTPYGVLALYGDGLDGVLDPNLLVMLQRGPTDVGEATAFPFDPKTVTRIRLEGARELVLEPPWSVSPVVTALTTAQFVYARDAPVWPSPELTVFLETADVVHPIDVGPVDGDGFRAVRDRLGGEAIRVPADELAPLFAD